MAGAAKKRKYFNIKDICANLLTLKKIKDAKTFICTLYKCGSIGSVNDGQILLFSKTVNPEALPPTKDALELHIKRAHYQAFVWKQAACQYPDLPNPDEMGWTTNGESGKLLPLLMTKDPIPTTCKDIISCSCKSRCMTLRCGCKKAKLFCTDPCGHLIKVFFLSYLCLTSPSPL